MTLYIYRVGWTYPTRNPITDLNLQRVLVVLGFQVDRSDPPVRPVGVARPATWSRPVRLLSSTGQTSLFDQCQFWSSTDVLSEDDIGVLGGLQELCILRLLLNPVHDGEVKFCVMKAGVEERCYRKIKVLEIASRSMLNLTIGAEAMENLELLKVGCCNTGPLPKFGALKHLK